MKVLGWVVLLIAAFLLVFLGTIEVGKLAKEDLVADYNYSPAMTKIASECGILPQDRLFTTAMDKIAACLDLKYSQGKLDEAKFISNNLMNGGDVGNSGGHKI